MSSRIDRTRGPHDERSFVRWPEDLGLAQRHVTMSDGTRLRVVEGGPLDAPLVLFLHGAPQMAYEWRKILPGLTDRARVLAPDLRGYGDSDLAGEGGYEMSRLVADVNELVDESRARDVILVAHDWGAVIAWRFAEEQSAKLRHLVMANAPMLEVYARELRRPTQLVRSWYALLFQLPGVERALESSEADLLVWMMRSSNRGALSDADLHVYREALARPGRCAAVLAYYRAARPRSREAMRDVLRTPRVEVPTTLFWGTWDLCLANSHPDQLRRFVRQLDVRLLDGVSHWVPEERPEILLEHLRALLPSRGRR